MSVLSDSRHVGHIDRLFLGAKTQEKAKIAQITPSFIALTSNIVPFFNGQPMKESKGGLVKRPNL